MTDTTDHAQCIERLQQELKHQGLTMFAPAIIDLLRPSLRLDSHALDDVEIPLGTSRIGGCPDLPAAFAWPTYQDLPLSFIAQVNLAEVGASELDPRMPASGLLSCFYDGDQRTWGFDPADVGSWHVEYTAVGAELVRHEFPDALPASGRFPPARLTPRLEWTAAPSESSDIERIGLAFEQGFAYSDATEFLQRDDVHRLLGHPDPQQGDMQGECQLVSNGISCGDGSSAKDPRTPGLEATAHEWRLLLQVCSDDAADMMWGDAGCLYFWIRDQDLADRRWDRIQMILQCG